MAVQAAILALLVAAAHSKTKVAGQVIEGGVQSETITWKLHVDVSEPLVTVYVTIDVPRLNTVPAALPLVEPTVVAPLIVYDSVVPGQLSL